MNKKLLVLLLILTPYTHGNELTALSDHELSKEVGQGLLTLQYQQGTNLTDSLGNTYNQSNLGFYKLGMEAIVELNANIKKLQLGCGGDNGAGACDLDIDNLALSGLPKNSDGTINYNYTSNDRTSSSAKITNPFIQFAIKNPGSAATREVLGFRLSAEQIEGLLTLGTENSSTPNGLNRFSGYMKTKEASGVATTGARTMTYNDTNMAINGIVQGRLLGSSSGTTCKDGFLDPCYNISYSSKDYNLNLSSTNAPFTIGSTVVSGNRLTTVNLKGSGTVERIDFSGNLVATVAGFLNLNKNVTGNITGLKTDITVNQNLGLIHALYLQNPASLSLQKSAVLWPGAAAASQKGWWLAMEDQVELGSLSPTTQVAITNAVLQQTIAGINADLTNNPRNCGNLLTGCVGGSDLVVGNVPMTTTLDFPLTNLTLTGQNFKPNCYGSLKFC
ncbi:hypothetical protein IAE19_11230 [Acinetobacter sp. S40]|uniref:hypothetical protein n=1 Tax=unclassified Acinetobacter TaxID=196816 RepID=UPI00190BA142|nr:MULTISPECIES: hypothetical protein [unclassified Acinetobacter]MBJ9986007.1 hypothetical protein [Acinetobacter sp. S40]MBK0063924.1 hypothetical protein [Acinetobacter sp. S55]MBK0067209.1 hypothetical protein [Acinetobacter sp. S54]